MWGWQNTNQQTDQGAGSNAPVTHTTVPISAGGPQGQSQGQELSEMLQMLDQSGTANFEDININMFTPNFE